MNYMYFNLFMNYLTYPCFNALFLSLSGTLSHWEMGHITINIIIIIIKQFLECKSRNMINIRPIY